MQLDQVTANIRLRSPWEAIDLGLALIRHSWRKIYLPWFLFLFTTSVLIFLVTPTHYHQYSLLAVWWLKPLFDRFLLNIISKQLFNEHLTTTDSLIAIPNLIKNTGLFGGLTLRRASFSRGFNLPIWQLEKLRGKARSDRQQTLLQNAHSHAVSLTIAMIFIELTLYLSIYALIIAFLPEIYQGSALNLFINNDSGENVNQWLQATDHLIYTLSVFLIEPFFIAASFTLYINRRTQLEAWDIELVFRQMAKRLAKLGGQLSNLAIIPLLFILLTTMSVTPLYAENSSETIKKTKYINTVDSTETIDNSSSKTKASQHEVLSDHRVDVEKSADTIKKIMQRHELSNEKKVIKWIQTDKKKEKKEKSDNKGWSFSDFLKPLVKLISILFESSLWVALGVAIITLMVTRHQWLPFIKRNEDKFNDYEAPEVMFGMDIRPQSLPNNIPETARQLWQENKHRQSLSLLYRGALANLVEKEQLLLKSSQTEGDIIKLTKQNLTPNKQLYFSQLTEQWKQIAYAHQLPEHSHMVQLFDCWQYNFINNNGSNNKIGNKQDSTHIGKKENKDHGS